MLYTSSAITVGFIEKAIFELRHKRDEGVSQVNMWGRTFQAKGMGSAKGESKPVCRGTGGSPVAGAEQPRSRIVGGEVTRVLQAPMA